MTRRQREVIDFSRSHQAYRLRLEQLRRRQRLYALLLRCALVAAIVALLLTLAMLLQ